MNLSTQINKIRDVDDQIFKLVDASLIDLTKDILKSKYPLTSKALIMLVTKSNFIKNSIFDICENEDLYSANILYRSLIEHSLRYQFIIMNCSENKNDDIGIDYYKYCDMGENLDFLKALKSTNAMFADPSFEELDTWKEISRFDKRFLKSTPKEIKAKKEQFNYKNMIKFLSSTLSLQKGMFKKIIPIYSELSSFVHGGPQGENTFFTNAIDEEARKRKLINICEITFEITKNIKLTTYLFASQFNQKYVIIYNQIKEASKNLSHIT